MLAHFSVSEIVRAATAIVVWLENRPNTRETLRYLAACIELDAWHYNSGPIPTTEDCAANYRRMIDHLCEGPGFHPDAMFPIGYVLSFSGDRDVSALGQSLMTGYIASRQADTTGLYARLFLPQFGGL